MSQELCSVNPPTELVSSFVGLLDISDDDYKEEHELHSVLNDVVQTIRYNKGLDQKVRNMDLRISLIVRNHLTTQELLCQSKRNTLSRVLSAKSRELEEPTTMRSNTGLVGHSKESQLLLDAYQQLFYILQTDPRYMAKLIFLMTQDFSFQFIESLVFTLYNCGSTPREACLMLQVFGRALKDDIRSKVDKLSDISTGSSVVLKMILNFFKTGSGLSSLKGLLQPVVEMIINDESLFLSTDPAEIYKHWINEQEATKGQVVQMPYDLSPEDAEKIPEVVERMQKSINDLKTKAKIFVNRIIESQDMLPYGICYIAKVLYECLTEKFPEASERDIMKSVGHILYYRYIIATIPAADTFGVISLSPGKIIHTIQRRNLGAIAKVLQHGAAFQLFEQTNKLHVLNDFLLTCQEKFLNFLRLVCSVDEPEVYFDLDAYTEATLLTKPEISLTLQEIAMCREVLEKHKNQIAPDPYDPLHQLLMDLGPPIVVDPDTAYDLITLSLTSDFLVKTEVPILDQLFTNTEQLVVQFLQCQCSGKNLLEMLRSTPTQEEDKKFQDLVRNAQCKTTCELLSQFANINEFKSKILHQLVQLELAGYVSSRDGYQTVVNLIAKKIVNRNSYRQKRKMEIAKLHHTFCQLRLKTKYYKDTLSYYSEYIENCLCNMQKQAKVGIKRKGIKCSAVKLMEMGILVEVSGLDNSQLKHASFEISTTDVFGVFSISVRYRSATVDKIDLDIQRLLQLQYEGETLVELFGGARINVNLLLHYLNRKFLAS